MIILQIRNSFYFFKKIGVHLNFLFSTVEQPMRAQEHFDENQSP